MPTYRMGDGWIHLKMAKGRAPVHCRAKLANGHACRAMSSFLCDHPTSDGHTCDMPLCSEHAATVGPDLHRCPAHMPDRG